MSTPAPVLGDDDRLHFDKLPPLSLYVHLPWCVRKCPYCDFNSYEARGALPDVEYVAALLRDLRGELAHAQGRTIETIYFGGGTPSLFSSAAIARLLDGVRAEGSIAANAEVTLEANPGAVDTARFVSFRNAGVNRLSIGIQSFRDDKLRALGRVHDAGEAEAAVATARAAGFANLNLDLMYGLPGDDVAGAVADLERAIALAPEHLSWYQLTLEPNTAFERRPPTLPDDVVVAKIEEQGRALLAAHGYERYEVSAYARRGRRSQHNLNYWQFGDYLGVGAGAHGKVTLPAAGEIARRAKTRNPRTYLQHAGSAAATSEERVATRPQAALEFLMNGLRVLDGAPVEMFEARAGQPAAAIGAARAAAIDRGWLCAEPDRLRATPTGLEKLNKLLELFA
ncbi:MAG TPA: radical SAM family heme chaperone HemW [Rhodanobacteraceae bacterium]|nr:radical SAM family heme chaperone HemW [Rhodanobacteraceae bacterium]